MKFQMWLENQKVVTFDFDSTLTVPQWDDESQLWFNGDSDNDDHLNHERFELIRDYAKKGYSVIIVTSRISRDRLPIVDMVKRHHLPISDVICTNMGPKGPILEKLGSCRHYDDMPKEHEDPDSAFSGEWIKVHHPMDHA
jgi:hypothetical protein